MDVSIQNGRAIFAPFTPQSDKDPVTKRPGVRAYSKIVGIILKFLGKAEIVNVFGAQNNPLYLNRESFKNWRERHGHNEEIKSQIDAEKVIKEIVEFASMEKKVRDTPTAESFYDRANYYLKKFIDGIKNGNVDKELLQKAKNAIYSAFGKDHKNIKYLEKKLEILLLDGASRKYLEKRFEKNGSKYSIQSSLEDKEILKAAISDCSRIHLRDPNWKFSPESLFFPNEPVLLVRAKLNDAFCNLKHSSLEFEERALKDCDDYLAANPNDNEGLLLRSSLYKKYYSSHADYSFDIRVKNKQQKLDELKADLMGGQPKEIIEKAPAEKKRKLLSQGFN